MLPQHLSALVDRHDCILLISHQLPALLIVRKGHRKAETEQKTQHVRLLRADSMSDWRSSSIPGDTYRSRSPASTTSIKPTSKTGNNSQGCSIKESKIGSRVADASPARAELRGRISQGTAQSVRVSWTSGRRDAAGTRLRRF